MPERNGTIHRRLLPRGIRGRLIALIALVLAPMLLLVTLIYRERYETRRAQAVQTELEVAQGIANTFAAFVADIRRQNSSVGEAMVLFSPDEPDAVRFLSFNAAQYRTVRSLSWLSPGGTVLASSDERLIGWDLSERSYFREIAEGRPWAVGDLSPRGNATPRPTFAIATAIREDGILQGAMVAGIEPENLAEAIFPRPRPAGGAHALFDRWGNVVYRRPEAALSWEDRLRWRQSDPLLQESLLKGEPRTGIVALGVPGGEWVSARVPIPETGWVAGAGRPIAVALAPVRQRLVQDAAVTVLIASAALLLAWALARSIARPLLRLEADARAMGAGGTGATDDPGAPEEVRRLRETVTEMAAGLLRRAEELRESEENFRTLADNIVQFAWMADEKGWIFWYNQRWYDYTGTNFEEMQGWGWRKVHHPDHVQRVVEKISRAFETGGTWEDTFPLRSRDGTYRWFLSRAIPIRDEKGKILRWFGTNTDVTEMRQAEIDLRESEERFRTLFTGMTEGFALGEPVFDAQGAATDFRFLEINDAFLRQTGLSPDIVGRPVTEVLPGVEKTFVETYVAVALGGEPVRFEQYNRDTDRIYDVYCYRPAPGRFAVIFRDVTENHRMQEALRQREAEFRQLAESLPQLVWVTRPDGYHEYFNRVWYDYTGTTLEETRGELWSTILHPDDYPRTLERWRRSLETGEPYSIEYRFRRADGEYRWFLGRASPLRGEAGEVLKWIGTCTEIQEQIETRQALQRQAGELERLAREKDRTVAMLDSMLTHAPAGFAFFDGEHRYVRVNEFLSRINGLPAEDHLGRTIREVLPENARSVDPLLDRIFEEGAPLLNIEIEGETPLYPGETRHWLTGWYPVPLPEGEEPLVGVVVLEVTEQKRLERSLRDTQGELLSINETLEERVRERTAELSAVNRELEAFTYTVSHDLRAPLRHVTSFVQILGAKYGGDLDEQGRRYLQIIDEAGRRMGALIDDLLAFSRLGRTSLNKTAVDLRRMTEEVRRELAPEAAGRRIEWRLGELPRVQADSVLLRTVLTNLLSNALKYTRRRDPAVIETGCRRQGSETVCFVRDNGAGFDMRYADKLFGVFQRLHRDEEFEGTGIGLASVRRIVHRHGGRTWAEGEIDRGATFYFSLPAEE